MSAYIGREQRELSCPSDGFGSAMGVELVVQLLNVRLDRVRGEMNLVRDLFQRKVCRQVTQHARLTRG